MANTNHIATSFITPQYVGELIQAQGAVKTPFLNRLGGIGGGGAKRARGWTFAMNSHNALDFTGDLTAAVGVITLYGTRA
jgi:hypothetical protein